MVTRFLLKDSRIVKDKGERDRERVGAGKEKTCRVTTPCHIYTQVPSRGKMIYETYEDVQKAGMGKWGGPCPRCSKCLVLPNGISVPIELFARVRSNGLKSWQLRCFACKYILGGAIAYQCVPVQFRMEVPEETRVDPSRPCARCGEWENGVEEHHWAPAAFFEDSEEWPKSDLCPECHRKWHKIMREQKNIWGKNGT